MSLAYRRTVVPRFDIQEVIMFQSDIARKLAAVVCTVLFSATCVMGAVGPATAGTHQTDVTAARQAA